MKCTVAASCSPSLTIYSSPISNSYWQSNRISGTIPSTVGQLTKMSFFWLFNNTISGTIPSTLVSMTKLYSIDISSNRLSGTLPNSLASISLFEFNAEFNQLSGLVDERACQLAIRDQTRPEQQSAWRRAAFASDSRLNSADGPVGQSTQLPSAQLCALARV
jgi:hypothetical protein